MTARMWRGSRCSKSNDLSSRMAPFRGNRIPVLGSIADDLLGKARFREMVPVAPLLDDCA
jgi:hypothetical protein